MCPIPEQDATYIFRFKERRGYEIEIQFLEEAEKNSDAVGHHILDRGSV